MVSLQDGKDVMNPTALSPVEGGNGTSIVLGSKRNLKRDIIPIAQRVAIDESNNGKMTPRFERKVM